MQCKACLYSTNHPFGLTLEDDICSGCITHDEKYHIDWQQKNLELKKIAHWAKKKSRTYDCVIPVIGDAEDYFVVSKVLELGMNPLIVSVNSYFLNNIGWSNLQNLVTYFDLDSWIYNPEIQTYKELIRTSLRKYNHMYLPWLQLHTSFPVHVAKEKNIPLVIWGGNQAVEQVGKFSHYDNVEMSSWSRVEHDLFGKDLMSLMGNGAQVNERKTNYYQYPPLSALGKNLKGIYLSNYMFWDPLMQNNSTLKYGFLPQYNKYTFDPFERAGSSVYYTIHDLLKYERHGYRKISDHLTREIRHGRISRDEAVILSSDYNKKIYGIAELKPFFKWLSVTDSGFDWFLTHRLKNSKNLITNSDNHLEFGAVELPITIKELVGESLVPSTLFLQFYKGIDIK